MQAWILEILFTITGRGRWAPYLASQLAIITAFWAVWQTGRRIAGETIGLMGALLLEGIIYYNFTSPEFNPNVLQIPFWALAGLYFYKSVKDNKIIDWLLLGLWAAAGLYTKYSTGLFLLVLALILFSHRDGRRRLLSAGPYVAVGTALLLFLPHLHWLIDNNFLPLQYTEGRLEKCATHYSAVITTLLLLAGQIIALLFATVLFVALYDRRQSPSKKPAASFDRIFLSYVAFAPFVSMLCVSLVFGYHIRDMWETPFWNFIGLWALVFLRPSLGTHDIKRFRTCLCLTFFIGLFFFVCNETLSPFIKDKPKRTNFPGKHLSAQVSKNWYDRYHVPLNYVIGDVWPAGNVAWYSDDRPHVYMDGDLRESPWIDQNDLKKSGGVIVWCIQCSDRVKTPEMPPALKATFPEAEIQEPLTLQRTTFANVAPAIIGWAILVPQKLP
jgi:hypothetical protein